MPQGSDIMCQCDDMAAIQQPDLLSKGQTKQVRSRGPRKGGGPCRKLTMQGLPIETPC